MKIRSFTWPVHIHVRTKYRHINPTFVWPAYSLIWIENIPVDTILNVHKTFKILPRRILNVLCTFSLRPKSAGKWTKKNLGKIFRKNISQATSRWLFLQETDVWKGPKYAPDGNTRRRHISSHCVKSVQMWSFF